jgi:hypothetical protein
MALAVNVDGPNRGTELCQVFLIIHEAEPGFSRFYEQIYSNI